MKSMRENFLGIDIGSISVKAALVDETGKVLYLGLKIDLH